MGGEVAAAAVGLARLLATVLTSLHGYIMEVTWSQCRLCTVSPCPHRQQLRHCLWNTRPRVLTTSASNTCTGWVRRPSGVWCWRHLAPAPRTRLLLGLRPDGGGAGAGLGLVPADLGVAGPAVHLLVVNVDLELQSANNQINKGYKMGYFVLQWLLALLAGEASSVKHSTLLHNLLRRVHLHQYVATFR